ncbi:MAG: hypothetical protein IIX91_06210 [Clostridia bacterium]|nr:hypothetical protein [Clostridia bacterium]
MTSTLTAPTLRHRKLIVFLAALALLFWGAGLLLSLMANVLASPAPVPPHTDHTTFETLPPNVIVGSVTPDGHVEFGTSSDDSSVSGSVSGSFFVSGVDNLPEVPIVELIPSDKVPSTMPENSVIITPPSAVVEHHTDLISSLLFSFLPYALLFAFGWKLYSKKAGGYVLAAVFGLCGLSSLYFMIRALTSDFFEISWVKEVGTVLCTLLILIWCIRKRTCPKILWIAYALLNGWIFLHNIVEFIGWFSPSDATLPASLWYIPATAILDCGSFVCFVLAAVLALACFTPAAPAVMAEALPSTDE